MSDVLCLHLTTSAMLDRVHSGALSPGTRVGRYEVESFLGAGGMGEVYIARDTTLGRRIALKVLPSGCARDRIARFIREAQASSALNHPAIVSVHDAGSADGIQFLAMELIDGEPLSDWMRAHRNARRAVELMAQVAEGLAVAHDAGIVHRDIKPANIMIGADGHAKIVDFGVAKLTERVASPAADTDLKTADGTRVGTVAYMSPEQIEGHEVDYRSDIFTFGTVLYELLTGKHPFAKKGQADTIYNVAHREPALESIPGRQRRIVARCLAKEPGERYQSMKDVAHDLRESLAESSPATGRQRRLLAWLLLGGALAVLLVALFLIGPRRSPTQTTTPPPSMHMERGTNSGVVASAAISPDGKFVVYTSQEQGLPALWVKQVATGAVAPLTPREAHAGYPVIKISADSNYVYYTKWVGDSPPDIFQIAMLGGVPRRVLADTGSGNFQFTVSPDGHKLALIRNTPDGWVLRVADVDGGGERAVLRRPKTLRSPEWSPDGSIISFVASTGPGGAWYLEEFFLRTGAQRVVSTLPWPRIRATAWLPDSSGMLVSAEDGTGPPQIWLIARNGTAPVRVTTDISSYYFPSLTADGRSFAAVRGEGAPSITIFSIDGRGGAHVVASGLGDNFGIAGVHTRSPISSGQAVRWIDSERILYSGVGDGGPTFFVLSPGRKDKPQQLIRGRRVSEPALSPDRKRLAFISSVQPVAAAGTGFHNRSTGDVWVSDIDGTDARQLTNGATPWSPVFSGDGTFVYYRSQSTVWRVPARGGNAERINIETDGADDIGISPDGHWLMLRMGNSDNHRIRLYPLAASGPPRVFDVPRTPSTIYMRFHPSSRSFGFVDWSDDGIPNIWLQNIDGGPPRQITHFDRRDGDIYAFDWSPDGKWLAVSYGEPKTDVVIVRDFR